MILNYKTVKCYYNKSCHTGVLFLASVQVSSRNTKTFACISYPRVCKKDNQGDKLNLTSIVYNSRQSSEWNFFPSARVLRIYSFTRK